MTRDQKRSPWIGGGIKPTLVGVYQRDFRPNRPGKDVRWVLWDGKLWHAYGKSIDDAARNPHVSAFQSLPWRGLRYDPALTERHP